MKKRTPILLILTSLLVAWSVGAQSFTAADVGTPALAGSTVGAAPGVQVITGGGNDIWGTSDNFHYYYATVSGQIWDAKVQVQDLQGPDWWSKCELMVRVPGSTGLPTGPDPFIAMMTTRSGGQNEIFPQWRTARGGNADANRFNSSVAPQYPNVWLRVARAGSVFSLYRGTDGTTWTKVADIDTAKTDIVGQDNNTRFGNPFPDPVFVGVAVTAHNDGDLTGGIATVSGFNITVTPHTPTLAFVTSPQDTTTYVGSDAYFGPVAATNTALANSPVGSFQWHKNGTAIPNAVNAAYALLAGASDNNAELYCVASMAGAASVNSSTCTVTVLPATEYPGYAKYQAWPGRNRTAINNGNYGAPSRVSAMPEFEAPYDWSANYGSRLSGLFSPPTDGLYAFHICADDDADLWLSTDDEPANMRLIAQQEGWAGRRNWATHGGGGGALAYTQRDSQLWSSDGGSTFPHQLGIQLYAAQRYFIMATHTEGTGGDNLGVYWRNLTDAPPADGLPSNLTNGLITLLTRPSTTLDITQQPVPVDTFEGLDATLSVTVGTDSELSPVYQWQRSQTNLPGANGRVLTYSPATPAHAGQYRCVVTLPPTGLSVTSAEVAVIVNPSVFINSIVKQEIWGPESPATRGGVEAGTDGPPTTKGYITAFDSVGIPIGNNYVQRLSTWFVPPGSGSANWVFLLSSDDDSDLFLSTNDDPATKRLIAQQTSWNPDREWSTATGQRRSDSWSPDGGATVPYAAGIPLNGGQQYYIEAVQEDGTGDDSLSVYAMLVTDSVPANGTASNLRGSLVGAKMPKPTTMTVTGPQSVIAHGYDQAVFSVSVDTDALYAPAFQWRKGGVNIVNATRSVYSPPLTGTNDSGTTFDCLVSLDQYGTSNSAVATLTVLGDSTFESGTLNMERFNNVAWDPLLNGNFGAPSSTAVWTILESGTNIADNFSRRISGFFIPPATDNYTFFCSADDQVRVYLSTNHLPVGKQLLCEQTSWNDARQWISGNNSMQRRSDTFTSDGGSTYPWVNGVPLVANQRYYLEVLHAEGSGGDNVAVTYKIHSGADPVDGDAPLLTGAVIGRMVPPTPPPQPVLTIVKSGANVDVSWAPTGGHLESKATITAPWVNAGTANPTSLPATGEMYFRVVVP